MPRPEGGMQTFELSRNRKSLILPHNRRSGTGCQSAPDRQFPVPGVVVLVGDARAAEDMTFVDSVPLRPTRVSTPWSRSFQPHVDAV